MQMQERYISIQKITYPKKKYIYATDISKKEYIHSRIYQIFHTSKKDITSKEYIRRMIYPQNYQRLICIFIDVSKIQLYLDTPKFFMDISNKKYIIFVHAYIKIKDISNLNLIYPRYILLDVSIMDICAVDISIMDISRVDISAMDISHLMDI